MELGEMLLPDSNDLGWRHPGAGQGYPVGLLPERTGDFQPLYPFRPEGSVVRSPLFLSLPSGLRGLLRYVRSLLYGETSVLQYARCLDGIFFRVVDADSIVEACDLEDFPVVIT